MASLEIRRQTFHICYGISIVILLYFEFINSYVLLAMFLVGLMLSFMARKKEDLPLISAFLKKFGRKEELATLPGKGMIFYTLGSFIAVAFFPKNIALASIMILALGDATSRLVGPYGYLKHPFHSDKFIEGIIAGAIAAFLGALFFVPLSQALFASVISMFIESLDIKVRGFKIDDNLMIPIASAVVMHVTASL